MTPEPQRLQYLEAMGLTAWVARYALPNARPTPACDWELSATPPAEEAPGRRLHALIEEAAPEAKAPPRPPLEEEARERAGRPGRARALLGGDDGEPAPEASREVSRETLRETAEPSVPAEPAPPAEALRFAFQAACLEGRWLVLLPGAGPLPGAHLALLANLLRAAGVPAAPPAFETFRWPLHEGMAVEDPLEEARHGLQAYVAGRRRFGWAPERLLLFGRDETLDAVLPLEGETCPTLGLPAWRGPSLEELAGSAEAKRALWPHLAGWREAWDAGRGGEGGETPGA